MDQQNAKNRVTVECLKDGKWSEGPRHEIIHAKKGERYSIHDDLAAALEKAKDGPKVKILHGVELDEEAEDANDDSSKGGKGGKGGGKGDKGGGASQSDLLK